MGLTKTLLMISFRKASHCSILFSQCPYPILAMMLNFGVQNFRTFFLVWPNKGLSKISEFTRIGLQMRVQNSSKLVYLD